MSPAVLFAISIMSFQGRTRCLLGAIHPRDDWLLVGENDKALVVISERNVKGNRQGSRHGLTILKSTILERKVIVEIINVYRDKHEAGRYYDKVRRKTTSVSRSTARWECRMTSYQQ